MIESLGYRTDLMLLQLGGSEVSDRGDYLVVRTPGNPTFWWGNYLLFRTSFGPGDVAARVATFKAEFPDAGHVAMGVDTTEGLIGADGEVAAAGFEVETNTVMSATSVLPPARPNSDATIRQLVSDDDWDRHLALSLAVHRMDVAGYEEFAAARNATYRKLVEHGRGAWFGAFEGAELVSALGLVSDGGEVARFQHVQTHESARGRGLASTLVHHASEYGLTELGAKTLVMVADPEYLAIRIYRALGFSDNEKQLQLTLRPSGD
ncbi:GNAT family N-acetyltransferase [Kribbella sp. NBC_01245]|uniref:GNAT family N-acetyltransferase n=1 Tax=Kribbella sp. NBC_01245 TaxID=2903578 RepID=UPI002E27B802|nr:GNAT family N-acetyltransferase [Kribbella sp. NBC_01245]